jgi:hypothetical protein
MRDKLFEIRMSERSIQISDSKEAESSRSWVGLTSEELEFYTEELGQGELGRGVLRAVVDFLKEKNLTSERSIQTSDKKEAESSQP